MSLPMGTWKLNANGRKHILSISRVDADGKLDITLEGVSVLGYWDGETRRILFQGPTSPGRLPEGHFYKTYVGYLLELEHGKPTEVPTLAGYYDYHRANEEKNPIPQTKKTFGWFAQLVPQAIPVGKNKNSYRIPSTQGIPQTFI